jgi:hypothetical protein
MFKLVKKGVQIWRQGDNFIVPQSDTLTVSDDWRPKNFADIKREACHKHDGTVCNSLAKCSGYCWREFDIGFQACLKALSEISEVK